MNYVPWGNETERADYYKEKASESHKLLRYYGNAEEDGRLIMLPCRVGGTIYVIRRGKVKECAICFIGLSENPDYNYFNYTITYSDGSICATAQRNFSDIGKTVFLTKEEAEKYIMDNT